MTPINTTHYIGTRLVKPGTGLWRDFAPTRLSGPEKTTFGICPVFHGRKGLPDWQLSLQRGQGLLLLTLFILQ